MVWWAQRHLLMLRTPQTPALRTLPPPWEHLKGSGRPAALCFDLRRSPWSPSLPGAAASSAFIHSGCSLTSHNGPAFPPLSDRAEISSSHQWNESWVSSLSFLFVHLGIGSFWKLHTNFFGRACVCVCVPDCINWSVFRHTEHLYLTHRCLQ